MGGTEKREVEGFVPVSQDRKQPQKECDESAMETLFSMTPETLDGRREFVHPRPSSTFRIA